MIWRKVFHRLELEKDLAAFRRHNRFLAEAGRYENPDQRVLIVSLSNWPAQIKTEIMLATAFRLQGWTPWILTFSNHTCARRYFEAAGMSRFVHLDLQTNSDGTSLERMAGKRADEILAEGIRSSSFLKQREKEVDIGRHVLSTLVRTLRLGHLNLADPALAQPLRNALVRSLCAISQANKVLERVQPKKILFLEKGYTPYGEIFDLALSQGLDAIQWGHSHRIDALMLKRYTAGDRTLHPFSLSSSTWAETRTMSWGPTKEQELLEEVQGRYESGSWFSRKYLQTNKRIKSPAEVRRQLGLDPSKKTAVLFSHVLWDATFFFGENLFEDYEQWLLEAVRAACRNAAVNWIVKLHPDYVWKLKMIGDTKVPDQVILEETFGKLPSHVTVLLPDTDISTSSLFEMTDYCLTVRGTIGIEMACFGIPVLTAGTGRYSGLGFTIDSSTAQEYLDRLRNIHRIPRLTAEQTELAQKHAYALLKLKPLPTTAFEQVQMPLEKLGHPLDHNVVIKPRSLQELTDAVDLKLFGQWACHSKTPDFLLPLEDDLSCAESLVSAAHKTPPG